MPGYILHLTAAQMFLDILEKENVLFDPRKKNDFLIGNLLPDTTKVKNASHFRNPKYHDRMVEYPETTWFVEKYKNILNDTSVQGYLFHLYIDRRFFKDYLPTIVEFQNEDGKIEDIRNQVRYVILKKTGEKIKKEDFFSEAYYYGDYTKMNTYLVERYHIPIRLNTKITNPGICEVFYQDVEHVLKELEGYLKVSASEARNVKVFDVEELLRFLQKAANEFYQGEL